MEHKADALIVGHGPAGCSAALYLCRAGLRTALVGKDSGALLRAEKIENYYGLPQPLRGEDLVNIGRRQAEELGAALLEDEVTALDWQEDGTFRARLSSGDELAARAVLLATGKAKRMPEIEGIHEFEGKGVSFCAVCDAFLYRGRAVAVLGSGAYALHELEELLPLAAKVTLLTHGEEPEFDPPRAVRVQTGRLARLTGGPALTHAEYAAGGREAIDGLFVALGAASAGDLARKLGLPPQDGGIPVDPQQATALPGLFAAGDCTGAFSQVAFAVAEGARAALGMIGYLRR